jgi:hypothetical protein
MNSPEDLIGKPIVARCWYRFEGSYFVPDSIDKNKNFIGYNFFSNGDSRKDFWSTSRDWTIAYNIIASQQIEDYLNGS